MPIDRSVVLVIPATEMSPKRVIKVGFVPFTIGTQEDADVRLRNAERWVQLRVVRRESRYRIVRDADDGRDDGAAGAWLFNGINLQYGGVHFRFFTHLATGAPIDARTADVEVVCSPTRKDVAFEPLSKTRPKRRRKVQPYVPRCLDVPPTRDPFPVPTVPASLDGPAYLERLGELAARLEEAQPATPRLRRRRRARKRDRS